MPPVVQLINNPYRGIAAFYVAPPPGADGYIGDELLAAIRAIRPPAGMSELHATLKVRGVGWRSVARWVPVAAIHDTSAGIHLLWDVNQYDGVEWTGDDAGEAVDHIEAAEIYFRAPPAPQQPRGGCKLAAKGDKHDGDNDCLMRALMEAFAGHTPGGGKYVKNASFKAHFGLGERDKFPLSKMHLVESALKVKIVVHCATEDGPELSCMYSNAAAKYPRVLHLELKDEHYTFKRQGALGRPPLPRAAAGRPRCRPEDIPQDELREMRLKPYKAAKCVLPQDEDMESYMAARQTLLEVTGLDLDRFAGRIKNVALEFFRLTSRLLPASPPLTPTEAALYSRGGAGRGGLIITAPGKADGGWTGVATQYDFVSFYPSLLMNPHTLLPIAAGRAAHTSHLDAAGKPRAYYSFGIYAAIVSRIPDALRCLWNLPYEKPAFFTHYDLNAALKHLGATVELWEASGTAENAVLYDTAEMRIAAPDAFRSFVTRLFAAKQAKHPGAKECLNMLTGALYERKRVRESLTAEECARLLAAGELLEMPENVTRIFHLDNGDLVTERFEDPKTAYAGPYPRFGPFMTSKGRAEMIGALLPLIRRGVRIVRCHTDGFLLEGPPSSHPELAKLLGSDLGQLRLERTGHCHCEGLRKPVWE